MTTVTYPSETFPGPPSVTMDIPEDWVPLHAGDAALAACRTEREGEFTPNVLVRLSAHPAEFDLQQLVDEMRQYALAKPEGAVGQPIEVELGGVSFVGCDVSWVDEQAGTLLQVHLFGAVPNGVGQDVVQLTGSVGGARAKEDYPVLQQIFGSVRVTR